MGRSTGFAVEIQEDGAVSPTLIGAVDSQTFDTNTTVQTQLSAGSPTPSFGEVTSIQPNGTITTRSIAALLGLIGMRGVCLSGGATPGFGLWQLAKADCGGYEAGSVHRKIIVPNGRIIPQSLSAQHGSPASVTAGVFSYWDGTNDPLIVAENQALPTGLPADVDGWHLGAVRFAGVQLDKKTSVNINWGISLRPEQDNGDTFARSLQFAEYRPTVSITCHDESKFGNGGSQIPLESKHGTQADTEIVLRKRVNGQSAYATGAVHLRFVIDGIANWQSGNASGDDPFVSQIQFTGLDDGTNDMIVADLAYTLP
ncbi:MAG: hypothetical protein AAFX06_21780 [Planctomycetota bacterium]